MWQISYSNVARLTQEEISKIFTSSTFLWSWQPSLLFWCVHEHLSGLVETEQQNTSKYNTKYLTVSIDIFLLLDEPMPDTQLLPDFCQHPITDDHYSRLAGQCQCHGKEWPKGKQKTSRALGPHQHEHILQLTAYVRKVHTTLRHASN